MSDRSEMLAFIRRTARPGAQVDGRTVGYLLADYDRLVAAARQVVESALPALELFAEELRLAQQALGEITGEFTADDLLGVIFSRFCIGK